MIFVTKKPSKIKNERSNAVIAHGGYPISRILTDALKNDSDIIFDSNVSADRIAKTIARDFKIDTRGFVIDLDSKKSMRKYIKHNHDNLIAKIDKKIEKHTDDSMKYRQYRAIVVKATVDKDIKKSDLRKVILKFAKTSNDDAKEFRKKLKKYANTYGRNFSIID